jgi:branched-chain amino acid transport system substrate-binding protein
MMKHGIYKLLGAAALSFFGFAAQAQDIKLVFNGDLSAAPSALSGQAAVLGLQAAIDDVNAAGGVLVGDPRRPRRSLAPPKSVKTCQI